jgi:hypothetical protein
MYVFRAEIGDQEELSNVNKTMGKYDYRNCASLFGYSAEAHDRSGGVCQLCLAGGNNFDFWRQLTVEHLIGQSQGGYLAQIKELVSEIFPDLNAAEGIAEIQKRK